jgi:hypothetical protein
MAHVTGGGIPATSVAHFQAGSVEVDLSTWKRPPVFSWLASLGVEEEEMRTSSTSAPATPLVAADNADLALATLEKAGESAWPVGHVVEGDRVSSVEGRRPHRDGLESQALIDDGASTSPPCGIQCRRCSRSGTGTWPHPGAGCGERETADFLEQHGVGLVVRPDTCGFLARVRAPLQRRIMNAPRCCRRFPVLTPSAMRWSTACG